MNYARRNILKGAGAASVVTVAVAAGLLKPGVVFAADYEAAFKAKDVAGALGGLGVGGATDSDAIKVSAPDIAENGAQVGVEVTSSVPGTESIAILAEKNATPLVAEFKLMNGAEAFVKTRIKLGKTMNVRAVVKAGGKAYQASKEVKVTIGGCGG